ncbi:MAG: prephenate dehydratase [Rhodospirillaceae bacterium]|jgi:prephenate dehydratase|nr:prephenate dehydratase [Rhodospirillaceae bacterium]MBT6116682.1 prephenate dehydratase [Rhodospirillaceae bacterium]
MTSATDSDGKIAFQGVSGAYSDAACRIVHPELETLPCESFEDVFAAVSEGRARYAMIPIDNSLAGRVADVHSLMPGSGLHVIAEHFQRINHHLLAPKGATLEGLKTVYSHVHALGQCRAVTRMLDLKAVVAADTAGAAKEVAERGDVTQAAIASALAAEAYGLDVLKSEIEDAEHNTTRFLVLAREAIDPDVRRGPLITTFVFRVRNVPAALYKAMGGFATNSVNMTKLESYMVGGRFTATEFYADVEGHPEERNLKNALEELSFFSREVRILGVYPAHPYRYQAEAIADSAD